MAIKMAIIQYKIAATVLLDIPFVTDATHLLPDKIQPHEATAYLAIHENICDISALTLTEKTACTMHQTAQNRYIT